MAAQRPQMQERRAWILLLAAFAYVAAMSSFGEAWLAPTSRRAAAATIVAGFGAPAIAQEAEVGRAGPAGSAIPGVDDMKSLADSAEVVAARQAWREKESKRQEEIYKEFRGWFTEFAKEGQSVETRAELLQKMQDVTLKEKMLPIGITREDVVKGVRAVKFNEGCIKDKIRKDPECKKLEKAYQKFLASIDKVYDRSLVTAVEHGGLRYGVQTRFKALDMMMQDWT
eukprot:CAMPEP_0114643374 /NCGR_PEP_ID=MMETSP0191-20121206/3347_1 /TAXON_ID=126664 /ORGANISM="Sorites sp." /LENGTH=226 /DNA_ID=CAMNT_0001855659 /DNA_START=56 /DNA_END=733 /DNA_ORIENTATION=-